MAARSKWLLLGLALLLFASPDLAGASGSFVVSGQIIKPDGTTLTSSTVNFKVEVRDSAGGSCVLWSETFSNTDMSATDGNFSLALGAGVRQDGGSHQLDEVFSNQKVFGVTAVCPAGYVPASGAERSLKITFDDSGGATQTFTSQSVKPVPTASAVGDYGVANLAKISGVGSSNILTPFQFDFLYKLAAPAAGSSTPCVTNDVLKFNGTAWICSAVAGGGGGVTNVSSANADIAVATGSTTPVLTLNSGTGASQIVKLDASAKLPAVDASQVTNLNANALTTGTLPAARLPSFTGDVSSSGSALTISGLARTKIASGTANHVLINDGTGALSSEANLAISRGGTGASTATGAINALVPTQTGNTGKVLSTDGTAVSWVAQTGGLPAAAGTATAPSYAFSGNANTGMFSPGANQIAFASNGQEKMRLDASGNMGIGTTAPGSALDVKGTLRLSGSTSGFVGFAPAAAAGSTTYTLPSADGTLNQVLQTNGAGVLSWGTPGGGGTVTSVSSANGDITVATGSSTPVLTLNSGTGPNQMVKLTAASKLPAVDGSLLTGLTTSQVSGVMQVASGGTNSGTALSGNRLMVSSGGAIVEAAAMTDGQIVVGKAASPPQIVTMTGDATVGNTGVVTVGKLQGRTVAATLPSLGAYLKWNNTTTQWEPNYQSTCTGANQVPHYNSSTDVWSCDTMLVDNLLPAQTGNSGKFLMTNGTTTAWLNPSGALPAGAGTAAAPGYAFSGNTNTGMFGAAANQVGIATNGVERIRVDASGNVGIGTTAPISNLHVKGAGAYAEAAIQDNTGLTSGLTVGLSNTANGLGVGDPAHTAYLNNSNAAPLALMTANTVRMVIDSTGKVGIGNSSPAALLDVGGVMRVTQICDSAGANCKTISGGWGASLSALSSATAADTIDNLNFAQTWNWSTATTQNPMSMSANALTTGSLLKLTTSSASFNSTSGLLNVANTSASTTGTVARIQSNSTATSGLTVLANGNVGVGTITPVTMLDVSGAVRIGFDGSACAVGIQGAQRMNGTTMEYCNGTAWQAYGVAGAGITSLNGLTGSAQTFSVGTAGTDFNINSSGVIHTFNLPTASATNRGALSSADWSTFNAKLGTSTSFVGDVNGTYSATSVDKIKGKAVSVTAPTTAQFLVYDGTTQYAPVSLTGDATMTSSGAMSISANAITTPKMFSNPGVNRLVATDGSTGATLAPLSCSNGNLLTWNISNGWQCTTQASLSVGSAANVTGIVTVANGGTGTSTGSITGTSALTFAAGGTNQNVTLTPSGTGAIVLNGNVGVGTASPGYSLDVNGAGHFGSWVQADGGVASRATNPGSYASTGATRMPGLYPALVSSPTSSVDGNISFVQLDSMNSTGINQGSYIGAISTSGASSYSPSIVIGQQTGATSYAERIRIDPTGKVGIGTTAPAATLDVAGTANISGSVSTATMLATNYSSSSNMTIQPATASAVDIKSPDGTTDLKVSNAGVKLGSVSGATGIKNFGMCTQGGLTASGTVFGGGATKVVAMNICSGLTVGGAVNCSPSGVPASGCLWTAVITGPSAITITIINTTASSTSCFVTDPTWNCLVAF